MYQFIRLCAVLTMMLAAGCSAGTNMPASSGPTLPQSSTSSLMRELRKDTWAVSVSENAFMQYGAQTERYCFPKDCKPWYFYDDEKDHQYDDGLTRRDGLGGYVKWDTLNEAELGGGRTYASAAAHTTEGGNAVTNNAGIGFVDWIYVSSNSKKFRKGTPVTIDATLVVTPGDEGANCTSSTAAAAFDGSGEDSYGNEELGVLGKCTGGTFGWSIINGPPGTKDVGTIATIVGAGFRIAGVGAPGAAAFAIGSGSQSTERGHISANYDYYLKPRNDAVMIRSASGHDYSP